MTERVIIVVAKTPKIWSEGGLRPYTATIFEDGRRGQVTPITPVPGKRGQIAFVVQNAFNRVGGRNRTQELLVVNWALAKEVVRQRQGRKRRK